MIELELQGRAESRVAAAGVLTVGRAWMNDLVIEGVLHVSGRHGQVEERDGALWYRDLGSRNGTTVLRVDGSELECEPGGAAVRIEPGDRLQLGGPEEAVVVLARWSVDATSSLERAPAVAADEPAFPEDLRSREDQRQLILQQQEIEALRRRLQRLDPTAVEGAESLLGEASKDAERVAPYPTPVLITGPPGSGKDRVARTIHGLSDRRDGPFLSIRCGEIAETLLQRELFGHEAGAFPSADRAGIGLICAADGGTLQLDEIEALTNDLQGELLDVLRHGEVTPVGGGQPVRVDVRIVAATRRDLEDEVNGGRFREELYERLAVFPVELRPLQQRPADIPVLAQHFAERAGLRFGKGRMSLSEAAVQALSVEPWPGNVRELRDRIERAALLCEGKILDVEQVTGDDAGDASPAEFPTLKDARRQFTIEHVTHALERAGGVQREAARLLGVDPGNFSRLLRELGLR